MKIKVKISKHKNVGIQLISDWKTVFVFRYCWATSHAKIKTSFTTGTKQTFGQQ
jgi:hypothetical protein